MLHRWWCSMGARSLRRPAVSTLRRLTRLASLSGPVRTWVGDGFGPELQSCHPRICHWRAVPEVQRKTFCYAGIAKQTPKTTGNLDITFKSAIPSPCACTSDDEELARDRSRRWQPDLMAFSSEARLRCLRAWLRHRRWVGDLRICW